MKACSKRSKGRNMKRYEDVQLDYSIQNRFNGFCPDNECDKTEKIYHKIGH
jgi:hypothetical protein